MYITLRVLSVYDFALVPHVSHILSGVRVMRTFLWTFSLLLIQDYQRKNVYNVLGGLPNSVVKCN